MTHANPLVMRLHAVVRRLGNVSPLLLVVALASSTLFAQEKPLSAEQLNFFESKIRPVLIRECYSCHSTKTGNAKGGLRLDTEQLCHVGGNSGPAVVPGDPDTSLLINAISYEDFAMPPNKQLPQGVIDDFRAWVEMGAPDPRKTEIAKLNSSISAEDIQAARETFWAYQRPRQPSVPEVADESWVRNPIDNFVLAKLEQHALKPATDAPAHVVLRRLCFDLTGLPPTTSQVKQFQAAWKKSPERAIDQAVELLLESPQFGERWGRHWLDVARYAESNGREVNMTLPHAWRYRDYVIDSLNADKPYDEFIMEQLAGDLLPADSDEEWAEHLIATGFLAVGPKSLIERNRVQFVADVVDEQLDVTTRVMLGSSIACARCHDHKFDPIPQSDYYALAGIFASTATYFGAPASEFGLVGGLQNRQKSNLIRLPIQDPNPFDPAYTTKELEAMKEELRESRQAYLEVRMDRQNQKPQTTAEAIRNLARTQGRIEYLSGVLGSVDQEGQPISYCMGVQDGSKPSDIRVLLRGEIDQPSDAVPRGFPQVMSGHVGAPARSSIPPGTSGRRELAEWIASPNNPLTARVMVNRIWLHLIGQGIVATTEDFGATGERPTHPELLDHLATEFVESGWSTKAVIRLIVTSRTFRISSQFDQSAFERDPNNTLHWRANRRRLDAEEIRDSMLAISGELDLQRPRASEIAKVGYMQVRDGNLINPARLSGMASDSEMRREAARQMLQQAAPNIRQTLQQRVRQQRGRGRNLPQDPDVRAGGLASILGGSERIDMVDAAYRSVYLPIVRDQLPRSLEVFDFAEPTMVVGQRETSNTANQSLFMLNNDFVLKQSESLARRVAEEASSPSQRIARAFELAYGRLPTEAEQAAVSDFVRDFGRQTNAADRGMLTLVTFCQSLLASAEFRFID